MSLIRFIFTLPAILLCLVTAPAITSAQTTIGGYSVLSLSLDEVSELQSVGIEAALFGPHLFLDDGAHAVTGHGFFGGYDEEGILSGVAASWQTARWEPGGLGLSTSFSDAGFSTWTIGVNLQRSLWESKRTTLMMQGVVAHGWMVDGSGSPTALYFEFAEFPDNPDDLVLIENFSTTHGFVHFIYQIRWGFLEPIIDAGWVGTHYSVEGRECVDGMCFEPGAPRSRDGAAQKTTFGAGAALRLDSVAAFAGLKVNAAAAMFLISITGEF